jgi:alpha-L-arabinofuranosidase
VLEALRDQAYTVIRYPGGNFLSGYNWLDGVGPKDQRPRRRELAWQSTETNQFGTNEFMDFCRHQCRTHAGVNMGTGTIQSAADLVEYCNAPSGTYWSDLRASHGYRARTTCATGAWAMRWTAPGRSATWMRRRLRQQRRWKPPR